MLLERYRNNPILRPDPSKPYESTCAYNPAAAVHEGKVYIVYRAEDKDKLSSLCLAVSKDGYSFEKYEGNPILKPELPEEKQGCEDPRVTKIGEDEGIRIFRLITKSCNSFFTSLY